MIKLVVPLVTSGALVHHSGTDIPEEFRSSMSKLMDHVRARISRYIMPEGGLQVKDICHDGSVFYFASNRRKFRWSLDVVGVLYYRWSGRNASIKLHEKIEYTILSCDSTIQWSWSEIGGNSKPWGTKEDYFSTTCPVDFLLGNWVCSSMFLRRSKGSWYQRFFGDADYFEN